MPSINKKISMGDLRKQFERIHPTAKNLHMNIIAAVMLNTDFKQVHKNLGVYYDFYQLKHIRNACKQILTKE